MQIIIEIPNSEIPKQQDIIEVPLHFIDGTVCEAGGYGFYVLPKGHGRLIDANETLKRHCVELCKEKPGCHEDCLIYDLFHLAPTIIEADKAESEDKE